MSGSWDAMLEDEQRSIAQSRLAFRRELAGKSKVELIDALIEATDALARMVERRVEDDQVEAAALILTEVTGEPSVGRFERVMAREMLRAAVDVESANHEIRRQS